MTALASQPWPVRMLRIPASRAWTETEARADLAWWAEQGGRPGLRVLARRWHWTGREQGRVRVRAFLATVQAVPLRGPPPAAQTPPALPVPVLAGATSGAIPRQPKPRADVHRGEAVTADEPSGRAQDRWARQHEPEAGEWTELARAAYWAMVDEPGRDRSRFTESTYRTYAAFAVTFRVLWMGGHGSLIARSRDARELGPCASKEKAIERAILLMTAELRPAPPRVRSAP